MAQYKVNADPLKEGPLNDHSVGIVKARHGLFFINPRDIYVGVSMVKYGEYCEHEWQFMRRFIHTGDHVIDAGANMGAFALPMARAVGPNGSVMAFEPQPEIFNCLQNTAALNKMPQLQVFQKGLGEVAGIVHCAGQNYSDMGHFAGHSLLEKGTDIKVEIVRIDDVFLAPRLSFMKIDVEGMEEDVLKGAAQTIRRDRPVLYVENDKPDKSAGVITTLMDMGYRMWWHTTPMFNPNNINKDSENLYPSIVNINMVCLPEERLAELSPLIPASLTPVTGPTHSLRVPEGIIPSNADDVTGV